MITMIEMLTTNTVTVALKFAAVRISFFICLPSLIIIMLLYCFVVCVPDIVHAHDLYLCFYFFAQFT